MAAAVVATAMLAGVPDAGAAARNVVLISIDSLRADHLPMYGYPRRTAPFLARLARDPHAAVYQRVTAVNPSCHPSHTTILTGRWPQQVGVFYCGEDILFAPIEAEDPEAQAGLEAYQENAKRSPEALVRKKTSAVMNWLRTPEGTESLATYLQRRGFATAGFVSIWTVESRFGYARGFDVYDDELDQYYGPKKLAWLLRDRFKSQRRRRGEDTVARAVRFVDGFDGSKRLFLFVHLADTHVPYRAPDDVRFRETDADRAHLERSWRSRYPDENRDRAFWKMSRGDGFLLDRYDRAIRHEDALLSELFEHLEAKGILDDAVVVVLADHGDSFGQHRYLSSSQQNRLFFEHSVYVWEETQHVPMIVLDPRRDGAVRVAGNVSQVDVVPTVLAALGFDRATFGSGTLPGRDLFADPPDLHRRVYFLTFGRGRPGLLEDLFTDFPRFVGFREGDLKFFVDRARLKGPKQGRCFLYDLGDDPNEKRNLCEDPDTAPRAARFRDELVQWYNGTVAPRREERAVEREQRREQRRSGSDAGGGGP